MLQVWNKPMPAEKRSILPVPSSCGVASFTKLATGPCHWPPELHYRCMLSSWSTAQEMECALACRPQRQMQQTDVWEEASRWPLVTWSVSLGRGRHLNNPISTRGKNTDPGCYTQQVTPSLSDLSQSLYLGDPYPSPGTVSLSTAWKTD